MTKAESFLSEMSPEMQAAIKQIAEGLKPVLDDIHSGPAMTQNYYGDYMRILSYKPKHIKLMGLALLLAGANPIGVEYAVKYS
jgi:hypothetical protein